MSEIHADFSKVYRVVSSCETEAHFNVAKKVVARLKGKYKNRLIRKTATGDMYTIFGKTILDFESRCDEGIKKFKKS